MNHSKQINRAKKLLLFTATTLLMNISVPVYAAKGSVSAAIRETFREKLPNIISKTKSSVKSGLSSAYQSVKKFDKKILFDKLLANIAQLGGQIGKIKDCMIYGFQCSSSERAAFYATAITILALTAAVVGFTITIAATSKEPDVELDKAVESTSQEIKGWKPEAVFQRLNNKLVSFKQGVLSMKECLSKRRCTRKQKRALYASAATIVALVTAAIGVGVGSYIYAEQKRQQEISELPGEQLPAEEEIAPTTEGFRPTIQFDETPIKEARLTKFQQFFRSKIDVTKAKAHELQSAYQQVKDQVKSGIIRTKEAAANKFLELIEKAKDFPGIVEDVLQVNLVKLRDTVQSTKSELAVLKQSLSVKGLMEKFDESVASLWQDIQNIIANIDFISKDLSKTKALKRLADIKRKDVETLQKKLSTLKQKRNGPGHQEAIEKARKKIEFKEFLQNRPQLYRILANKVNELDVYKIGNFANGVLNGIARILAAAQAIHQKAGKIGLIISPDNIQHGLGEMQYGINSIGTTLKKALQNKPLIIIPAKELHLSTLDLIKAAITRKTALISGRFELLRKNLGKLLTVRSTLNKINKITKSMEKEDEEFSKRMGEIQQEARAEFIKAIRTNPLRAIPNAAAILRNTLESAVGKARRSFDRLIEKSMGTLTLTKNVAPLIFAVFQSFNEYLEKTTEKPFINKQLIQDLTPILTTSIPNIAEGAKKLITKVEATPEA